MEKEKAWESFTFSRKKYRQTVRAHRVEEALQRYHQLDKIFAKPSTAYAYIRSCRSTKQRKIEKLVVGDEEFTGAAVCDGFYKSMTAIKQCNLDELRTDNNLACHFINYDNIVHLCQNKPPIPSISLESTQYQGTGSSHELASLLVTEAIQYSSKPIFILALDAQSAFDRCLRQVLCSELYKTGVAESAILYMDSRLANRRTVYEWEGVRMGPAEDNTF